MPAAPDALPRPFGKYTLLERLGQGGMAEVLLARQEGIEGTHRLVAIKRVHPTLARDEEFVEMFLDEVRIVLGLSHPNIGHIFDVGKVGHDYYIAMEYVQGRDLAQVLRAAERRGDKVPVDVAIEIGRQVCAALDHAHRRTDAAGKPMNVVHRDIAPDNVILTFDGSVKLVDFGIAMAENRISRTQAGMLKGKPPYMAPEQVLGETVDGRADVFALGVLLYRLVTGEHPFVAPSPEETFQKVVESVPDPPESLCELPAGLSGALLRALAKEPDERYSDARAFEDALDRVMANAGMIVSPRQLARWLVELFPEAAAARERLLADPLDSSAAATASYLSAVQDGRIDADTASSGDRTVLDGLSRSDLFDEMADATREAKRPPDPRDGGRTVVVVMEEFEAERAAREATRAPRYEDEDTAPEGGRTEAGGEATAPRHRAPDAYLGPVSEIEAEVWRLRDHFEHLPVRFKTPVALAIAAALVTGFLILAALGVRSCF